MLFLPDYYSLYGSHDAVPRSTEEETSVFISRHSCLSATIHCILFSIRITINSLLKIIFEVYNAAILFKRKNNADAWFQLIYNIFDHSYKQNIQKGSFEKEQYRLQYPGIAVFIEHPDQDMIPIIPPALGIPSPRPRNMLKIILRIT